MQPLRQAHQATYEPASEPDSSNRVPNSMEIGLGSSVDYPRQTTLATLFDKQVARQPKAAALLVDDTTVTYEELDRVANAIARQLITRGVEPGDVVGVSLERSPLMVASMLGAMRLGAAFLPLDPSNPAERLRHIVSDSRAKVVLTTAMLAERLKYADPVILDDLDVETAAVGQPVRRTALDPLSVAYVAYTSGSTGQPKGVMGTHRAAVNRFAWMWREFPFAEGEAMCQKTAISFVDSIWEIFGPLLAGVPQVIVDNTTVRDPAALLKLLGRHGVTRLLVVPSLLKAILETGIDIAASAPALRLLFCSGERLPKGLAQQVLEAVPAITLVNLYGSSEVAADVTYEVVTSLDTDEVPIGRPIDNARLYVLDEARQPARPGEVGELFVGGDVLAAGYLHKPRLTAERFLPDPFSNAPDALMFATGDRVNWLPDGRLMFCGRVDQQVKIRGARVELGEIETVLGAMPSVAEVAVVAQRDADGETKLLAFVTGVDGTMPNPGHLRAGLVQQLPDYMIPARIEALETMPLNPNGKVDRVALAARPTEIVAEIAARPANEIELELQRMWAKLLSLPGVGLDDDFFTLGGHSLMAVKMFVAIKAKFGVDLPIATLLAHPTIASLAAKLSEGAATPQQSHVHSGAAEDSPWDTTAIIHPGPDTGASPLFIVGGIGGNVNNLFDLGRAVGRYRPLIGLQTRGIMGHRLHETFEATAADHLANIKRHQPRGPYLLAGYSGGAFPAYEMARQLEAAGEKVAFLGILDMHAPGFAVDISVSVPERLRREINALADGGIGVFWSRLRPKLRDMLETNWLLNLYGWFWPEHTRLRKLARAWWDLDARYRPGPYRGDVTLFLAEADGFAARMMREVDPEYGWRKLVKGKLRVIALCGNHFGFLTGKGAADLAERIEATLTNARKKVGKIVLGALAALEMSLRPFFDASFTPILTTVTLV